MNAMETKLEEQGEVIKGTPLGASLEGKVCIYVRTGRWMEIYTPIIIDATPQDLSAQPRPQSTFEIINSQLMDVIESLRKEEPKKVQ
ncbi:hypothetical protein PAAG_03341 [Paracoccidioides lutzii Pb01]|uniref:Uncharacterized protein n=1 Tax=Paracoccidioides lutzii (strain ATCC MYA-826 / Pb01) TaxID=502779 RepID=C1GWW7_PARBA|nr:hypothetical protein PAAG_03341 [Paracoccidioides lutzii Pb01]EEH41055.2 hypothetical protein PAAG_03341 [Paracoccidioides lutzii Pb01]